MNMHSPHFLFIGSNSQVLESYRRHLVDNFGSDSIRVATSDAEITSFESISALFIDVEHLNEVKKWDVLSKTSSLLSMEVPIIVISHVDEASILKLDPRIRVLKKPLGAGELLHEAKNVIAHQDYVSQAVQYERLTAIRSVLRGISHELGNIVLRVAGKADLAMMETDVAAIHSQVEGVVEASQKASMLVKNLQAFAKAKPYISPGKISKAIEDALHRLESTIQKQKVLIQKKLTFENAEPELGFDLNSMIQAFFNLFENAIIAMPQGGTLNIEMSLGTAPVTTKTQSLVIQIKDSGVGMTPDVLKRAFDFAYSTRKDQASGLGLPVARELVRSHGGELTLKSEAGRGTEISIWLPVRPC